MYLHVTKNIDIRNRVNDVDYCFSTQQMPSFLWDLKFHYHDHNRHPLVSILSKMNLVQIPPSYFCKIHFDIILQTKSVSFQLSLSLQFSF
jgi:hypothetical protein